MGAGIAALTLSPLRTFGTANEPVVKAIPASGESIPVIGMGTWRTFNVGRDEAMRDARTEVLKVFFEKGGGMIDSSPMYGSAQEVLGYGFEKLGIPDALFSADKVWTRDGAKTRDQVAESEELWGIEQFDLMQVHNLVAWEPHLESLWRMKEEGRVRYVGISTSHGRRHDDFERIMKAGGIDFIQVTYNLTHRDVERRILPLATDEGIAVIANRPFDGGSLVRRLKDGDYPLPDWAEEFDCDNWAEFLLKFIVSHPDVTCAIPATTRVSHMRENMGAGRGRMPDAETRDRMIEYVENL